MNRLLWMAGAAAAMTGVARAELAIVDTALEPGGTVRVEFEDTGPPMPYTVERFESANPQSPWAPLAWQQLECVQPARYAARVAGAVAEPGLYRVAVAAGWGLPLVIATDPANGAAGVSPQLDQLSVTFDRPMQGTAGVEGDANWGASFVTWSADHRTAHIHRLSWPASLPAGSTLRLTLNATGEGFCDEVGHALAPLTVKFTTGSTAASGPHVVSSFPASGEVDVDPYTDTVELRFSEPMMATGGFSSMGWWPWTLSWSADGRTAFVRRGTAGTPVYHTSVMLSPISFYSATGTPMTAPFTLQFTTAGPPAERVEADPAKGFYWPYYLLVPPVVTAPGTLLVEPNNTGTWGDDPWFHEESALALLDRRSTFAMEIGCPLLVPVFPRPKNPAAPEPGGIYVHALDRYSLSGQWAGIQRIDLQMEAMISDALERLRAAGHAMDDKVFMMGFSASGAFTSRFAALHPDRLKAAACGSPGGWPCCPAESWQGTQLGYPFGVKGVADLTGEAFDLEAFRQVALYIYVGGSDTNDAIDFRGMSQAEKDALYLLLNYPADRILANRWPLAESIFSSVGANATFAVYPGVTHTITTDMFNDLKAFFAARR